jgi:uncharacterized protein (TIGR02444 family)
MAADGVFWRYSLALYGRPGVAEACLALQDAQGIDVNLLLFCCWAGDRGKVLSAEDLVRLIESAGPWYEAVVKPLRSVRRWLKSQDRAPLEAAERLRQEVKAQELEAERLEQAILAAEADLLEQATQAGGPGSLAVAGANLAAYLRLLGLALTPDDERDLAVLLAAAVPGATQDQALAALGVSAGDSGLRPGGL